MTGRPKKRRQRTWIEVAVANGGFRKAIKALNWAHTWIHVEIALGREPSVEEVADWWNLSRRSAFREQAAFRDCFPNLDNPAPLYADPQRRQQIADSVRQLEALEATVRNLRRPKDTVLLDTGLEGA